MLHCIYDVLLHHVPGQAKAFSDFRVRAAFHLAQQKRLATRRRQFVQRPAQQHQLLGLNGMLFGIVLVQTLLVIEAVERFATSHPGAAMQVDAEVGGGLEEKGARLLDIALRPAIEQAHKGIVRQIGGSLTIAKPPTEVVDDFLIMVDHSGFPSAFPPETAPCRYPGETQRADACWQSMSPHTYNHSHFFEMKAC